ncbi:MAG TPA: efflux RND transporter periplasmic adaptor subunit [Polyangia bacterium]
MITFFHTIRGIAALGLVAVGCTNGHGEEASADKRNDFVRYDPKHGPLDFIKIEIVSEGAASASATLPGRVTFDEDHTQRLASPIDGRAIRILVNLGDKVRAGQPLIELSSPSVGAIQADAQKALSDLHLSEKANERVHTLQTQGAVADKEVAQVQGDLRKAQSDFGRASVQLKALGISPSDPAVNAALRAQIPGVVVERNVLVGQEVRADQATPLLTVSQLDSVWVVADAYEQDLSLVQEGDPVVVRVPAYPGETFAGKVKHIGDVVDSTSRTVKVRSVINNPGHRLKPEMFGTVEVQNTAGHKVIRVPSTSVLNEGDRELVIVAAEGSVFHTRRVEVGPESNGTVRIVAGLIPGERIVTQGAIFMKREIEGQ